MQLLTVRYLFSWGPPHPSFSPRSMYQVIYSPDADFFFPVNNITGHTKYFTGETPLFTQSLHQAHCCYCCSCRRHRCRPTTISLENKKEGLQKSFATHHQPIIVLGRFSVSCLLGPGARQTMSEDFFFFLPGWSVSRE